MHFINSPIVGMKIHIVPWPLHSLEGSEVKGLVMYKGLGPQYC